MKLAPASAEAHNWLGAFLMGRGNLPDSISELRRAVALIQSMHEVTQIWVLLSRRAATYLAR